jgi:hypothetical protein
MTPLNRIFPIFAQADQPHVFRQSSLDILIARARSRVVRCDLEKLKRVIQLGYARDLKVLPTNRLQTIFGVQKMV